MDQGASSSNNTTSTTTQRSWCHRCTNFVQPVLDASELQCPTCHSSFIDQIAESDGPGLQLNATELWAPLMAHLTHNDSRPVRSPPQILRPFLQNMSPTRRSRINRLLVMQERDGLSQLGVSMSEYLGRPGLETLLHYISENEPARNHILPAKKEEVAKMARVKVEEIMSCPICMEDYVLGEEVRKMPCNHIFHQECILSWFEMHSTCPICRYQMPVEETKEREAGTGEREQIEERERFEAEREMRRERERESRRNGEVAESSGSGGTERERESRWRERERESRSRTRRSHGLFERVVHQFRNNDRSDDHSDDRYDDANNDC